MATVLGPKVKEAATSLRVRSVPTALALVDDAASTFLAHLALRVVLVSVVARRAQIQVQTAALMAYRACVLALPRVHQLLQLQEAKSAGIESGRYSPLVWPGQITVEVCRVDDLRRLRVRVVARLRIDEQVLLDEFLVEADLLFAATPGRDDPDLVFTG